MLGNRYARELFFHPIKLTGWHRPRSDRVSVPRRCRVQLGGARRCICTCPLQRIELIEIRSSSASSSCSRILLVSAITSGKEVLNARSIGVPSHRVAQSELTVRFRAAQSDSSQRYSIKSHYLFILLSILYAVLMFFSALATESTLCSFVNFDIVRLALSSSRGVLTGWTVVVDYIAVTLYLLVTRGWLASPLVRLMRRRCIAHR